MRNYYDEPVNIRATKLVAAEKGYDAYMSKITPPAPVTDGRKVAVIGGGPTGMSAAYFVGRAGIPVTLFEKADRLGGIVRQVIPAFRISDEAIDKDVALIEKMGVEVKLNTEAPSVAELKAQGYTHIFFAVGAWKAGRLDIPGNVVPVIGWLRDMKAGKDVSLGHVAATPPWTPPGPLCGPEPNPLPWCTAGRRSICPPTRRSWRWPLPTAWSSWSW